MTRPREGPGAAVEPGLTGPAIGLRIHLAGVLHVSERRQSWFFPRAAVNQSTHRFLLVFALALLGGCETVFDIPSRALRPAEIDETLSWWRLPDRSGRFEPRAIPPGESAPAPSIESRPLAPPPVADLYQRLRRGFAMPELNTARVRYRQNWYAQRPELTRRIFERSSLYLYHILEEVEKRQMPTEIALIPFVESGFNPQATSEAGAAGIWQFIPVTAAKYNLRHNAAKDERRDILASTDAALDYLESLHRAFGDWHLALAAYNWGEISVGRAVERNRALGRLVTFEHLSLPEETRDYVPKLQAIKNIVRDPGAFGIEMPPLANRPYFAMVAPGVRLEVAEAARMADMTLQEFLALNPSFGNRMIPRGARIALPLDRVAAFEAGLEEYKRRRSAARSR